MPDRASNALVGDDLALYGNQAASGCDGGEAKALQRSVHSSVPKPAQHSIDPPASDKRRENGAKREQGAYDAASRDLSTAVAQDSTGKPVNEDSD